jgi:hypothetical protein
MMLKLYVFGNCDILGIECRHGSGVLFEILVVAILSDQATPSYHALTGRDPFRRLPYFHDTHLRKRNLCQFSTLHESIH